MYVFNRKTKSKKKTKIRKLRKEEIVWIDIESKEEFNEMRGLFNIHPVTADDCLKRNSRIKIEIFDEYAFIIAYCVKAEKNTVKRREIDFIIGKNFLITNHIGYKVDLIEKKLEDEKAIYSLLERGSDFLMQHIIDILIESYFPTIAHLDEEINTIETKMFKKVDSIGLQNLYSLKREVIRMRRHTTNHREILLGITTKKVSYISSKAEIYFRDTYDKVVQISDMIDTLREVATTIVEIHTTLVSNKMNEIMKVLTIIATIMLPLSVIGSIYGMNFRYMPELYWKYGYPFVLGVMVIVAGSMLFYFRRKKWI